MSTARTPRKGEPGQTVTFVDSTGSLRRLEANKEGLFKPTDAEDEAGLDLFGLQPTEPPQAETPKDKE